MTDSISPITKTINSATRLIDVQHLGKPGFIATGVLETPEGIGLVDPGPTSSMPGLVAGLEAMNLSIADISFILLTHIHLDHAGATGTLVHRNPNIRVYVHKYGAPHMIEPARLLASATRLYGDQMDYLWGEFRAVPAGQVTALAGGEVLRFGSRAFLVDYTPGHASHHVSYFDESVGMAFIGDCAGLRLEGLDYALPVTPPPDIKLEEWHATLELIRAWQPQRLYLTHFGPFEDVDAHLDQFAARLDKLASGVQESLTSGAPDDTISDFNRANAFTRAVAEDLRATMNESDASHYEDVATISSSWHGLARYWRKKEG